LFEGEGKFVKQGKRGQGLWERDEGGGRRELTIVNFDVSRNCLRVLRLMVRRAVAVEMWRLKVLMSSRHELKTRKAPTLARAWLSA
jgi:hypothetical protein